MKLDRMPPVFGVQLLEQAGCGFDVLAVVADVFRRDLPVLLDVALTDIRPEHLTGPGEGHPPVAESKTEGVKIEEMPSKGVGGVGVPLPLGDLVFGIDLDGTAEPDQGSAGRQFQDSEPGPHRVVIPPPADIAAPHSQGKPRIFA